MAYPETLDDLIVPVAQDSDPLSDPDHPTAHNEERTAINSLETKVGIDGSTDPNSIDYGLYNPASISPGHLHHISDIIDFSGGGGTGAGGTKLVIDTTSVIVTGSTVETDLYTETIPAATLGTNDAIEVETIVNTLSLATGNTCTFRVKFGGATVATLIATGVLVNRSVNILGKIIANNATGAQIAQFRLLIDTKVVSVKYAALTIDSTVDQDVVITGQLSSNTDSVTAKGIIITEISGGLGDGTIDLEAANQDLSAGNTVGVGALIGGVALAGVKTSTIGLPDTADAAVPTRQIWLSNDNIFVLYKVSGAATLKGVVGTVDKATMAITFGTPHTYSTTLNTNNSFALAKLDTDKVAIIFAESGAPKNLLLNVSTASGQVITASSNQAFATLTNNILYMYMVGIDTNVAVLHTRESSSANPLVRAFGVSGTTLGTIGTPITSTTFRFLVPCGTDKFIGNDNFDAANHQYIQVGTVNIGTFAITLGSQVDLGGGVSLESDEDDWDIVSYTTDRFVVTGHVSGTIAQVWAGTISGTTPTVGSPVSLGSNSDHCGLEIVDTTRVIVNVSGTMRVFTPSGTTMTESYTIDNSAGGALATDHNFLQVDDYWIIFNNTESTLATVANKLFILGMSFGFLGICEEDVTVTNTALVLLKGSNGDQSNLVPGQHYTYSSGGLSMNSSGVMVAKNATTIII